jgi:hypothetical protein
MPPPANPRQRPGASPKGDNGSEPFAASDLSVEDQPRIGRVTTGQQRRSPPGSAASGNRSEAEDHAAFQGGGAAGSVAGTARRAFGSRRPNSGATASAGSSL